MVKVMQAFKLEEKPLSYLADKLRESFTKPPVVSRTCIKILNLIIYNLIQVNNNLKDGNTKTKIEEEVLTNIVITLLKGIEDTEDVYLETVLFIFLIELTKYSKNQGIMTINSLAKEIDAKMCFKHPQTKNLALRTLFLNLPENMLYDFEKYVKQALMNEKTADNSVVLCSEYFKKMQLSRSTANDIADYHSSFFCKMALNKHSALLEIEKCVKDKSYQLIFDCLHKQSDDITQLEACKALLKIEHEHAAPFVEKAVQILRIFLKSYSEVKVLAAIKVLNQISLAFSKNVARANREIEDLIHSPNKSISMLAILTLLKTGNEESVRKLALKLEPYLSSMTKQYKVMAIETMEKLSNKKYDEYVQFLQRCLLDRKGLIEDNLHFKRFLIKKIGGVLDKLQNDKRNEELYTNTVEFLATYLEDPEYYQLAMEILGILGKHLFSQTGLMHVYNRLILDNQHVRNCALQTLFDLDDKFGTLETLEKLNVKANTQEANVIQFLSANKDLHSKKDFDLSELGDLQEQVKEMLGADSEETTNEMTPQFLKEESNTLKICRPILLTDKNSDFTISLTKKIDLSSESPRVVFVFEVKSNMEKVVLQSAVLKIASESEEYVVNVEGEGEYLLEVAESAEAVYNGVFEYQIALEEDMDDVEKDKLELNAFELNVLDFTLPVLLKEEEFSNEDLYETTCEFKLKCSKEDALTMIIQKTNMYLVTNNNEMTVFTMSGIYFNEMVVIHGTLTASKKHFGVALKIKTTGEALLEKIGDIF